jgi:hypothetical protein
MVASNPSQPFSGCKECLKDLALKPLFCMVFFTLSKNKQVLTAWVSVVLLVCKHTKLTRVLHEGFGFQAQAG